MWLSLYHEDSESYELIQDVRDSFFLVAIVDNEFQKNESLWGLLLELGKNKQFL